MLNLVRDKKCNSTVINTSPILLPSSNQCPAVRDCWNCLNSLLPKTCVLFKSTCTNARWKIQNLKYDASKGAKRFIFTKICLGGEERLPDGRTVYHAIYFYPLSRSALYKTMVRNDDPLQSESVLLKALDVKLMSNMPAWFFDKFHTIFDEHLCLVLQKNGTVFVSIKRK